MGEDQGVLEVGILRETALYKQEEEQAEEKSLADSSYPDQVAGPHTTTLCPISFCES